MMKPSRRSFGSLSALKLTLVCGATSALAFITLAAAAAAAGSPSATSLAVSSGSSASASASSSSSSAATAAANKPSSGLLSLPANGADLLRKRNENSPADFFREPLALESNIANAKVQVSPTDMAAAAGHHHGKSHGHGKYYMYAEVPKKHSYKMGFKRGNHKHTIERKESLHKSHFHTYFKWHDKKGKGSHKWEYKHEDKKKKHHY